MQSIESKILSRIYGRGRGWAFTANDFSSEFKRSSVDWALSNLASNGTIRRICRGVYDYPKFSELLNQTLSSDFDQVAQAIARKFKWRIQASGDATLNLLGLSTQVPGKIVYLSDGPDRYYLIGQSELYFKKAALKEIGFKHRMSGLVVHALKALGKAQVNQKDLDKIRSQLDAKQCKQMLDDTRTVSTWVHELIRQICKERS